MLERPTLLRSGPIVLDTARREVSLNRRPLEISGLPLRILEELIRSEGETVSRAELKRKLWPHAQQIDIERRLNTAVRALREALGDNASEPRLVRTVRGCGYRWIGSECRTIRNVSALPMAAAAALALLTASPASLAPNSHPNSSGLSVETELSSRPDDLKARRQLAWKYINEGRRSAALPHLAALVQSGSIDAAGKADLGWLLLRSGMPEAALVECTGQVHPSLNLLSCRQTALARLGLIADARSVAVQLMKLAHANSSALRSVAGSPVAFGYAQFLKWRVSAFVRPNRDWFQRAQLEAEAGMYERALTSLSRAAAVRDPLLVKINSSAEFAPLHSSPEYQRIARAAAT